MKLSENRPLACLCLALVVLGTLFIGGGNALGRMKNEVSDTFSVSSESISAELKELTDNAVVMNSIAVKYNKADSAAIAAVNDAIEGMSAAQTISEKYDASIALKQTVEGLYSNVTGITLSETDLADFRYKYKNFDSAWLRISHDSYNEEAAKFNAARRGFPAGLISAVRGIKDAELFG